MGIDEIRALKPNDVEEGIRHIFQHVSCAGGAIVFAPRVSLRRVLIRIRVQALHNRLPVLISSSQAEDNMACA